MAGRFRSSTGAANDREPLAALRVGCFTVVADLANSTACGATSLSCAVTLATGFSALLLPVCGLASDASLRFAPSETTGPAVAGGASDVGTALLPFGEFADCVTESGSTTGWWEDRIMKGSVIPTAMMTMPSDASITRDTLLVLRLASVGVPFRFVFFPILIDTPLTPGRTSIRPVVYHHCISVFRSRRGIGQPSYPDYHSGGVPRWSEGSAQNAPILSSLDFAIKGPEKPLEAQHQDGTIDYFEGRRREYC